MIWWTSEYASHGKGTDTFIDFDFGQPVALAGVSACRSTGSWPPIDAAELTFADQPDFQQVLATEAIDHVNTPGGTTMAVFREPHVARYVRWKVTQLNAQGHSCVGGRDIRFFTAESPNHPRSAIPCRSSGCQPSCAIAEGSIQPVSVTIDHAYAESMDVVLKVGDLAPARDAPAVRYADGPVAGAGRRAGAGPAGGDAARRPDHCSAAVSAGCPFGTGSCTFFPTRTSTSAYTHVQTEVEQKQWSYLRQALEIARNTASYPPAAQFKWNCEVMWAVDSFLKQASDEEKQAFAQAVRDGVMHLDGLYGNELTALCRPEELMRLVDCARRTAREYDVVIDAAMISDVPGYTWGIVPALVQSGIKYLSIGPNHVHRIGGTLEQWGDRPFYWVSPSGQERLLCWMAGKAYSWFHAESCGHLVARQPAGSVLRLSR